jgi:hypothetical protein
MFVCIRPLLINNFCTTCRIFKKVALWTSLHSRSHHSHPFNSQTSMKASWIIPETALLKPWDGKQWQPGWKQMESACHLLSRWFLARLILLPGRWTWYVPSKRRLTFRGLHGVVSQKIRPRLFLYTTFPIHYLLIIKERVPGKQIYSFYLRLRLRKRMQNSSYYECCICREFCIS